MVPSSHCTEEFYSDAKPIHEDVDGMVWQEAKEATEGGLSVDTGGGNAFGGGDDEEVDDCEGAFFLLYATVVPSAPLTVYMHV